MITHVFKDGTRAETVTGKRITESDCPAAYAVLGRIARRIADDHEKDSAEQKRVA